jgi:hypothetical protein
MQATTTTAAAATETKVPIHTLYAFPGVFAADDPKDRRSVLRLPLTHTPKELFCDLVVNEVTGRRITDDAYVNYKKPFDRMLSRTEGDGGLTKIPDFFLDYTLEKTNTHLVFTGLFESVCRIALVEYYYSFFPENDYKVMMKRTTEYNSYSKKDEKKGETEVVDDFVSMNLFGTDGGDY